jgi:hypothetical protein
MSTELFSARRGAHSERRYQSIQASAIQFTVVADPCASQHQPNDGYFVQDGLLPIMPLSPRLMTRASRSPQGASPESRAATFL